MRRVLIVLILALSLIIAVPVFAEPGQALISFDSGSYYYQISSGSLGDGYSGQGVDRAVTYNGGTTRSTASASALIPVNCQISSVTFWVRDEHPGNHLIAVYFLNSSLVQTGSSTALTSETSWVMKTITPGSPTDTAYVRVTVAQTSSLDTPAANYQQVMKLDEITVYCADTPPDPEDLDPDGGGDWSGSGSGLGGANLIRPLQEVDEDSEWGIYESENTDPEQADVVIGVSNAPGDFVFAASDGIVTVVEELTQADCEVRLTDDIFSGCIVVVPASVTGSGEVDLRLDLLFITAYRVVISGQGYDLEYFVANAPEYITVGDDIQAGCYLGEAFELRNTTVPFAANENGFAVVTAISQDTEETMVLLPFLNLYAIAETACNADPAFKTCTGDANLSHSEQWSSSGSVTWQNPGALLGSNARIAQTLNLNDTQESSLTVGARILSYTGGTANLRIQLGATIEDTPVNNDTALNVLREYTIDLDFHDPDQGLFYSAAIAAAGNFQVEVVYACVTQGDDAPPSPSSSCYFTNPSFDYGTTDWSVTGTVIANQGDVTLTEGSSISQQVHLFEDENTGPHTYTVSISYQAVFTDPPTFSGVTYQMEYRYPATGDWTAAGDTISDTNITFTHTFEFEVSEETDSAFSIRANITETNGTFVGVRLLNFCIFPPYPFQQDYGGDYFFTYTCTYVSKPVNTEDLSVWTEWHWLNLNRFFSCDLMVLLRRIEVSMNNFFTTVAWAIRYWMSMLWSGADWLGTNLFPWLNGHFYNMAIGQSTYITAGEEQCGNIFCLFTGIFSTGGSVFSDLIAAIQGIFSDLAFLLSQFLAQIVAPIINTFLAIIYQGVSLLLNVITGIVTIAFALIGLVFGLFNTMMGLVSTIVTAWNTATPTPVPGLPACQIDPQSNGICIGLWMMENTIFSGTGALLIPLLIGYASIMLILWAIGTFKKTLTETAAAL